MSKYPVRNTIIAMVTVLLFYFGQGAAVVMGQLEGVKAIVTQATIIWSHYGVCNPQNKEHLAMHLLHAFHDFCGFITYEGDARLNIIVGTIQFAILMAYCIYLTVRMKDNERNR